ncbi:MAG: hypothetical protein NXI22_21540 [bacterium]|nr:hypothetical protein [bacterium]
MKRSLLLSLLGCAMFSLAFAGGITAEEPPAPEEATPETIQDRARKWIEQYGASRKPSIYQKNHSKVLESFRSVVADVRESTVRVLVNGKQRALGVIADPDGFVLTKASELSGDIECELADGTKRPAKLVGVVSSFDLGMLHIDATDLDAIDWGSKASEPQVGSWLATVGQTELPVSIGVVSVASRVIGSPSGVLGIMLDDDEAGVRINQVLPGSGAEKAGLHVNDIVKYVKQFKPGDRLRISVLRGDDIETYSATLGNREALAANNRANIQNTLGGELSRRRTGFASALQHDTVLRPMDCGGPVVDLTGSMVALNIARAGRVNSYALPLAAIVPLLSDLKAGKYSPDLAARSQLEAIKSNLEELRRSESTLANKLDEFEKLLKKRQSELAKSKAAVEKAAEMLKKAEKQVAEAEKKATTARRELATAKAQIESVEAEKTSLIGDSEDE